MTLRAKSYLIVHILLIDHIEKETEGVKPSQPKYEINPSVSCIVIHEKAM